MKQSYNVSWVSRMHTHICKVKRILKSQKYFCLLWWASDFENNLYFYDISKQIISRTFVEHHTTFWHQIFYAHFTDTEFPQYFGHGKFLEISWLNYLPPFNSFGFKKTNANLINHLCFEDISAPVKRTHAHVTVEWKWLPSAGCLRSLPWAVTQFEFISYKLFKDKQHQSAFFILICWRPKPRVPAELISSPSRK